MRRRFRRKGQSAFVAVLMALVLTVGQIPISAFAEAAAKGGDSDKTTQVDNTTGGTNVNKAGDIADTGKTDNTVTNTTNTGTTDNTANEVDDVSGTKAGGNTKAGATKGGDGDKQDPAPTKAGSADAKAIYTYSSPAAGGSVTTDPAGSADPGDIVQVYVSANTGYSFSDLSITNSDGDPVGKVANDDGWSFMMPESLARITATFDAATTYYSVMTATNGSDEKGGTYTINGGGYNWYSTNQNAPYGTEITLEAHPRSGYGFEGWYAGNRDAQAGDPLYFDDQLLSTSGSYTFTSTATGGSAVPYICAVFKKVDSYNISIGKTDGGTIEYWGSAPVGSSALYGSEPGVSYVEEGWTISMEATADSDYTFLGWYKATIDDNNDQVTGYTGSAITTENPYSITVSESAGYCAVFAKTDSLPEVVSFQVWAGNIDGQDAIDKSGGKVAVTYDPGTDNPWSIAAKDGTSFSYGEIADCYLGDNVTVTAQAEDGFQFVGWYEADGEWPAHDGKRYTGTAISTDVSYTFAPTNQNRLICAVFEESETPAETLAFHISSDGNGKVNAVYTNAAGSMATTGSTQDATFEAKVGTEVTLYAVPNSNYYFSSWYMYNYTTDRNVYMVSDESTLTFDATPDETVTDLRARFAYDSERCYITGTDGGGVRIDYTQENGDTNYMSSSNNVNMSCIVKHNTQVTLTATPKDGNVFDGWYDYAENTLGERLSTSSEYTFTFTESTAVRAVFKAAPTQCTITFDDNGSASPGVMGPVTVDSGSTYELPDCLLLAPSYEYTFDGWQIGDVTYKEGDEITVTGDITVVALWKKAATFVIMPQTDDSSALKSFTVNGVPTYYASVDPDSDVTFVATPGDDWVIGNITCETLIDASKLTGEITNDWVTGGMSLDLEAVPAGTYLVTVTFEPAVTLTYDANGGTPGDEWRESIKLSSGTIFLYPANMIFSETVIAPPTSMEFDGFTVTVGSDDPIRITREEGGIFYADADTTVKFEWKAPSYNVTFDMGTYGSEICDTPDAQTVAAGNKAEEPSTPVKGDVALPNARTAFEGWYTQPRSEWTGDLLYNDEDFDFDTAITEDTTLYAAFRDYINVYAVDATMPSEYKMMWDSPARYPELVKVKSVYEETEWGEDAGTFAYVDTPITVTAREIGGWQFKGWAVHYYAEGNTVSKDDAIVSTDKELTTTFDSTKFYYAIFEPTDIEEVQVGLTVPEIGDSAAYLETETFLSLPANAPYSIEDFEVYDSEPEYSWGDITNEPFTGNFEAGKTYYAWVLFVPDDAYYFMQGGGVYPNTQFTVTEGGTAFSGPNLAVSNYWSADGGLYCTGEGVIEFTIPDPLLIVGYQEIPADPNPAGVNNLINSVTIAGDPVGLVDDPEVSGGYLSATPIAAGSSVTLIITPKDNGMVTSVTDPNPAIDDWNASISTDGVATITFTMPGEDTNLTAILARAVSVVYDANGGTPGVNWPTNNVIKYTAYDAADEGHDFWITNYCNSSWATPPAGCDYAGLSITYDNGTTTSPNKTGRCLENVTFVNGGIVKWEWSTPPSTHLVTFDSRGGTPAPSAQTVEDGGHATKPANPQKENLHFLGWFEKEPAKLTKADITGSNWGGFNFTNTAITDDLTLHAAWYADFNGNSYDITDPDNPVRSVSYSKGGSIIWTSSYQSPSSPTTQWYSYSTIQESEVTITANPFEGYEFVCWALNSKPSSDEILSTSATYTFTFNGEMTIYGLFQKATHTVSFDTGEGDAVPPQTVAHGGYATAPTDVKWNNYDTMGWHTAANPDTAFNFSETPIMGDVVLYPNWVLSTSAHAINKSSNYSMGGGTVKRTSESLVPAMPGGPGTTALTLSASGSTVSFVAEAADGFEFVGWTAGTNPTGTILSTEKTFSFTAESTSPTQLFALFQEKTNPTLTVACSISSGNNINNAISSVTVNGEALTMSEPDDGLLRPDPTVQGKIDIAPGEEVTVVITPTDNYTVFGYSFTNISGHTGNMAPDGTATITFEMPEENAGVSASLTRAVNVEYDANGGTPTMANWPQDNMVKLAMGMAVTGIPINAANFANMVTPPTGLTFAGLEVTHDGGTTTVAPDSTLSNAKFTQGGKIKWLWSGGKKVHFDANGGDGTMDDVTVAEGAEYELPKCGFMAPSEDKAFDKWQVGDQYYSPGDTITVSDDVTVVATWKDAVNIIIIAFGPDDSLESLTVNGQPKAHGTVVLEPGADIEIVAAPKTGYAVSGTNMTTNLGATSAYDPTTGNMTVSAEDVAAGTYIVMFAISTSVTVHFDAVGGTPAPDDQILPKGRKAIEPVGDFAPVKDGWNLLWWYDANDTEKSEFDFDTAIQEDTTLKAAWSKSVLVKVYDKTIKVPGEGGYYLAGNNATHYITGNHQVLEGGSATFTAYPAEASLFTTGPRMFLGWCEIDTTSPEEHITSQNATYTINNYNGAPKYLTAVFAEAVDVAFDANGGSPTPETQTIEKGTKAQAPETVTKENLSLLGWFEGTDFTAEPVDFATQTFSSNTTLTAGWYGQFTATAYDKYAGKAEQGGTIALSGGSSGVLVSISRHEGAEITLTATPSDNYRFVGWAEGSPTAEITITEQTHTWTYDGSVKQVYAVFAPTATVTFDANGGTTGDAWKTSETVDAGTNLSELLGNTVPENPSSDVVTAPAGKIFNGYSVKTADMDNPKNFFIGNEIDFELTKSATVKYLWRDPILTIRWSSIDGDDLMDAWYCRNVAAGTTVGEALSSTFNKALSDKDYFEKDGYEDWGYRTPKPMSTYSDYFAMYADEVQATDVVEADMDIYVDMIKQIDEVSLTLEETPVCGTEVTTDKVDDQWSWATQTPVPNVTLADGVPYVFDTVYGSDAPWCFWIADDGTWSPFVGTFEGGKDYSLELWLKTNFGYTFTDDVTANFTGVTNIDIDYDGGYIGITGKATAEHVPGDAKHENEADPTCTEDGSYDEVVRCTKCDEIISTKHVTVDKLGHKWGEWEVVEEPTEEADGLEKHVCERGDAEETRPIDKLSAYYYIASGDGSVWIKGSGEALGFAFKRSLADDTTYNRFKALFIDGKEVPTDAYVTAPGSVAIGLSAAYLETLEVGKHTITASFDDDKTADGTFTVKAADNQEENEEATDDTGSGKDTKDYSADTLTQTGDNMAVGIVIAIVIAALAALIGVVAWRRSRR